MLSYYRNALLHVFIGETIVACALAAYGKQIQKEGVSEKLLFKDVWFLFKLLKREIVSDFNVVDDYKRMLDFGIIHRTKQDMAASEDDSLVFVPN